MKTITITITAFLCIVALAIVLIRFILNNADTIDTFDIKLPYLILPVSATVLLFVVMFYFPKTNKNK